jgi:hypothetical protein
MANFLIKKKERDSPCLAHSLVWLGFTPNPDPTLVKSSQANCATGITLGGLVSKKFIGKVGGGQHPSS